VTGLLLVGVVAERDGVFAAAGRLLARLPLGSLGLHLASLALVVGVTAVLNLDTSVFFLTPVVLRIARSRGVDEAPYLYGVVFMSNAGSLFLPGSNLTNVIVLHHERVSGSVFFVRLLPASLSASVITAAVLCVWFRRSLLTSRADPPRPIARNRRRERGAVSVQRRSLSSRCWCSSCATRHCRCS